LPLRFAFFTHHALLLPPAASPKARRRHAADAAALAIAYTYAAPLATPLSSLPYAYYATLYSRNRPRMPLPCRRLMYATPRHYAIYICHASQRRGYGD